MPQELKEYRIFWMTAPGLYDYEIVEKKSVFEASRAAKKRWEDAGYATSETENWPYLAVAERHGMLYGR